MAEMTGTTGCVGTDDLQDPDEEQLRPASHDTRWGSAPDDPHAERFVFPCRVRTAFKAQPLPRQLALALGVHEGSSWDLRLPEGAAQVPSVAVQKQQLRRIGPAPALCGLTASVLAHMPEDEVRQLVALLPWSNRTRNVVLRVSGGDPGTLAWLLCGAKLHDLLDLRGMTVGVAMTVLSTVEAYLGCHEVAAKVSVMQVPDEPVGHVTPLPAWACEIRADDPRFTEMLTGYVDLAELPEPTTASQAAWRNQAIDYLTRQAPSLTLEEECRDILGSALSATKLRDPLEWLEPLGLRFGLTGDTPLTLEEVGRSVGFTRERVRQVQNLVAKALPSGRLWAPVADQVLALVEASLPSPSDDLHGALGAAGLTGQRWSAEALAAALALTGRDVELVESHGIISTAVLPAIASLGPIARRLSNARGVAAFDDVLAQATQEGHPVEAGLASTALRQLSDVHWLSRSVFWADHPKGRNRLVNTSLRILAVHSPQSLESMHTGVRRDFAFRAATSGTGGRLRDLEAPDKNVLRLLYAAHPAFYIDDQDQVTAVDAVGLEDLGDEKLTMVQILRSEPYGASDRNSLISACAEAGMNTSTVQIFLTYGECFEQLGANVWGLRGVDVPRTAIEGLQASARTRRAAFDKAKVEGHTASGRPWMARRLSPDVLHSGVLSLNFHRDTIAASSFQVIDANDGEVLGLLRCKGSFAYGLLGLFKKYRPAAGDALRMVFFRDEDYVLVEVGGGDLLGPPPDLG